MITCGSLKIGVCSKDDCDKLKSKQSKDSYHARRSKQNSYHVTNKNIASSALPIVVRRKRGCLPGHPQARRLNLLRYYLGVPWASPSFGFYISSFLHPSSSHPKLENFNNSKLNKTFVRSVSITKQLTPLSI